MAGGIGQTYPYPYKTGDGLETLDIDGDANAAGFIVDGIVLNSTASLTVDNNLTSLTFNRGILKSSDQAYGLDIETVGNAKSIRILANDTPSTITTSSILIQTTGTLTLSEYLLVISATVLEFSAFDITLVAENHLTLSGNITYLTATNVINITAGTTLNLSAYDLNAEADHHILISGDSIDLTSVTTTTITAHDLEISLTNDLVFGAQDIYFLATPITTAVPIKGIFQADGLFVNIFCNGIDYLGENYGVLTINSIDAPMIIEAGGYMTITATFLMSITGLDVLNISAGADLNGTAVGGITFEANAFLVNIATSIEMSAFTTTTINAVNALTLTSELIIEINATTTINVIAGAAVDITAGGAIAIDAGAAVAIDAAAAIELTAGAAIAIDAGAGIAIDAFGAIEITAGGLCALDAGGLVTLNSAVAITIDAVTIIALTCTTGLITLTAALDITMLASASINATAVADVNIGSGAFLGIEAGIGMTIDVLVGNMNVSVITGGLEIGVTLGAILISTEVGNITISTLSPGVIQFYGGSFLAPFLPSGWIATVYTGNIICHVETAGNFEVTLPNGSLIGAQSVFYCTDDSRGVAATNFQPGNPTGANLMQGSLSVLKTVNIGGQASCKSYFTVWYDQLLNYPGMQLYSASSATYNALYFGAYRNPNVLSNLELSSTTAGNLRLLLTGSTFSIAGAYSQAVAAPITWTDLFTLTTSGTIVVSGTNTVFLAISATVPFDYWTAPSSYSALNLNGDIIMSAAATTLAFTSTTGGGPPTYTPNRSLGTRIILGPAFSLLTSSDYAIGIDYTHANISLLPSQWYGVPNNSTHIFYVGTYEMILINKTNVLFNSISTQSITGAFANSLLSSNSGSYTAPSCLMSGDLAMTNSTAPRIYFRTAGAGVPTILTRSVGAKLVLYPAITSLTSDYAIGIASSVMWYDTGAASSAHEFYINSVFKVSLGYNLNTFTDPIENWSSPAFNPNSNEIVTFNGTNCGISTQASVAFGEIYLQPKTFGSYGNPTLTNRSAGTRIVIWPTVSSTTTDFAIGVTTISDQWMWYSVPALYSHTFYVSTTPCFIIGGSGAYLINTSPIPLQVTDTTNSTNYLSGCTTLSGGLGVAKDVFINGLTDITSTLTVHSTLPASIGSGSIYTLGGIAVEKNVTINRATTILTNSNAATTANTGLFLSDYSSIGLSGVIMYNISAGAAPPQYSFRSAGSRVILYPTIDVASCDYALGIDSNAIWITTAATTSFIQLYAGTTLCISTTVAATTINTTCTTLTAHTNLATNSSTTTSTSGTLNLNGDLILYNTTKNTIIYSPNGIGAPAAPGNRSVGSKIVLYPQQPSAMDYSLGIASASLWYSAPSGAGHDFWVSTSSIVNININAVTIKLGKALVMNGSSSGAVSINTQPAAGTFNFNLPITAGSANTVLVSGGGSTSPMTWSTILMFPTYLYIPGTADIVMAGSTSGAVSINTQAVAGTYNFNLPITGGTALYALCSGGGGAAPMTWEHVAIQGTDVSFNSVTTTGGVNVNNASPYISRTGDVFIEGGGAVVEDWYVGGDLYLNKFGGLPFYYSGTWTPSFWFVDPGSSTAFGQTSSTTKAIWYQIGPKLILEYTCSVTCVSGLTGYVLGLFVPTLTIAGHSFNLATRAGPVYGSIDNDYTTFAAIGTYSTPFFTGIRVFGSGTYMIYFADGLSSSTAGVICGVAGSVNVQGTIELSYNI